jgi:mevalonate kinase
MKKQITVSAPGKLMLFGEHAVLHGHSCLVTAVNQRIKVTVEILDLPEFHLEALDVSITGYQKPMKELGKGEIPKGAKFVEIAVRNFMEKYPFSNGIKVTTKSEFSTQFGFGSSSASTVCVIKALSELFRKNYHHEDIFHLSYKTVLDIQKKGSGFDIASAIYGGTIYYALAGKMIEPIEIDDIPVIVGYSGVKADTVTIINQVTEKAKKYPDVFNEIYEGIETVVELGEKALIQKDWEAVGELMDINQGYLSALGVSSKKLSDMIYLSREAGAYGVKLSGAGGGDCVIAFAPDEKREMIEAAIIKAGGEILHVTANAEGVRIEK